MSSVEQFSADLERIAQRNGVFLDLDRTIDLVRSDIVDNDAFFVNVFRSTAAKNDLLLITSESTLSLRTRLFKLKVMWEVRHEDLEDVRSTRGQLGPYVYDDVLLEAYRRQFTFRMGFMDALPKAKVILDIAKQNAAVAVQEIQGALDLFRSRSLDPGLKQMRDAMQLIDASPPSDTESSEGWGTSDYANLAAWMCSTFDGGMEKVVWERRLALGYSLERGPAKPGDWFWINALPALAALDLGLKQHPFVATCAAYVDQVANRLDDGQMQALNEIKQRFFG